MPCTGPAGHGGQTLITVDHNAKTQSSKPALDGSGGGGVGVAEMRERKMKGQGGPSPQVSRSHPDTVLLQRVDQSPSYVDHKV